MKSCLVCLLLVPTILALVGTAVYHTSVNSELRFEKRDTNAEYINIRRSYRPKAPEENNTARSQRTPQNKANAGGAGA